MPELIRGRGDWWANLVYVMRRELTPSKIEEILEMLTLIFEFTKAGTGDLLHAAGMGWNDFEDALQSATAERVRADYIITRNIRDFNKSKVMALTPGELLARL